ncbi:hypothetical protein HYC85_029183 [Camellia sinensis]|uniref:Uncharacterized protein n=1 Tax=Camellia sinensis TaxID=4442 RepID=A0A7J7FXC9_CAMSI|nr:hypothetical protein HYC85_029183 [Camellia sinensis]
MREHFLGPTRVLDIAPGYDRLHYIAGPLPPNFVARRENVYRKDYIFTIVPNPLKIINIQNVDFSNDLSYIETPDWIADRAFLGYIQSVPHFHNPGNVDVFWCGPVRMGI